MAMAHVLAYTSPARGHLFPLVPVLDELRRRGHTVSVRTLAAEVDALRARGMAATALGPAVEAMALSDWRGRGARDSLRRSVGTFAGRAPLDAADLGAAIDRDRPDAVLVDINAWGAMAAAEAWGGAWAAYCPFPLPLSSADAPPFGPGLPPARGPLGRLRDRLVRPLVMGTIARTTLPPLNAVRAGVGVPPLASADDIYLAPPLLLAMTAEPFEYPRRDWPSGVVLVGPCDWDPPAAAPAWLAEVRRPLVLVTTSSEFQDDGALVRVALEALADEPVTVVATVPAGDPADFAVPPNARVERFVPHGPLLERAACALTHGGMGATQKALAHGVPVCVVPFGRDQLEVARRVVTSGAGTAVRSGRLTAPRLRAAVREAARRRREATVVAAA
ncbi:glycosyltransferase, partial [Georgenia thermotolerans]